MADDFIPDLHSQGCKSFEAAAARSEPKRLSSNLNRSEVGLRPANNVVTLLKA